LSLVPVFAYGLISGLSPATQRAVIMVAIFLLSFLLERDQDPINTLALAALVILVVDPTSLFSISFQLSFTAVFAIIFAFSHVRDWIPFGQKLLKTNWRICFLKRLVSFFMVSLFAICGSLPLVMYYFNQISVIGLLANFFIVPLVGFIVIPLGLLALFLLPASVTLTSGCLRVATEVLKYALAMVDVFAELPFASIKTVSPSFLEIGCFYGICGALFYLRCGRPKSSGLLHMEAGAETNQRTDMNARVKSSGELKLNNPVKRHQRKLSGVFSHRKIAMIALGVIFFTLAADTVYWLYQRFWHTDLRVTVIDVGHGFASLLELPGGYTIMIDGGGFSDNSLFDIGEKVVAPFLWKKKIKTVDTLILSHPNSDHLNGLLYIADHFNVKDVWTNNEPRNTLGYLTLMQIIANKNINLHEFRHMPADRRINGVDLKLLYPPKDFLDRKESEKWRNPNNNSLVVRVSFGHASFLFPGDIMSAAEKELVGIAGDKLSSAVLIAPHHGSFSSSTETLLDIVKPKVVIVSSDGNRRFKFPHATIVKRYERRGYALFRTDRNGAIHLSTNGQYLSIKPFVGANSANAKTWLFRSCSEGKSVSDN